MPVMDEFKEEREALKHGSLKDKISYFFDYYKWHTVAAAAIAIFAVSFAKQIFLSKDTAFYAIIINALESDSAEAYNLGFAEYAGIDTGDYELVFDSSSKIGANSLDQLTMASSQKLMALVSAREVDVFLTDENVMTQYAYNEIFYDLREVLSDEQIERYSPYFYYMDQTVMEEREAALKALDADLPEYPNPRHPEKMSTPIPVGIYLEDVASLQEYYYFSDRVPVIGIVVNTQRAETAAQYIDYIFQENLSP